jgi:hypothetical protein
MAATGYVSTAGDARKVDIAGDVMTGELVLPDSSPDTALAAASRGYIDGVAATLAALAGATFTGQVNFGAHVHVNDILVAIGAATSTDVIAVRLTADTARRLLINAGGVIEFGGGTTAVDTNLYRAAADTLATDDDFLIQGTGKGYRFRRGGAALDLEATGVDLILSNWSGTAFDGTQRSYDRYAADALAAQHAGKREFVSALYGAVRHTIDPDADQLGFHGEIPVSRQTVTGSRGGNAALASLLTALDTVGLITDGSTA